MLSLARSLLRHKRLLKELVVRDLKARYVGSAMGFFWSVIYPFIMLFVYMLVFRVFLNMRWTDKASPKDVAVWMLAGIVVWAAFSETVTRSTNSLVENSNLIQKVVFPSEVLPVSLTISSLINMMIGVPIVMLGVAWFAYVKGNDVQVASLLAGQEVLSDPGRDLGLGWSLVVLPLLIVLQGVFTLGLGYFLSAFNLILRDTYHLVGVGVVVWMFSTPIFYPPHMVAEKDGGKYAWMLEVNPMHWLISSYREVLVYGAWPDPALLARFGLVALVVLMLGAAFFRSQKDKFPDLL